MPTAHYSFFFPTDLRKILRKNQEKSPDLRKNRGLERVWGEENLGRRRRPTLATGLTGRRRRSVRRTKAPKAPWNTNKYDALTCSGFKLIDVYKLRMEGTVHALINPCINSLPRNHPVSVK